MNAKERKWVQTSANASPQKKRERVPKAQEGAEERYCVKIAETQVWNNRVWELPTCSRSVACAGINYGKQEIK